MSGREIELISSREEVSVFLPQIIAAATHERDSFGFLPAKAYEDFAVQGRLIVAKVCANQELAGYVIFGGTMPQARIFQTYVDPGFRRRGLARLLVDEVITRAERDSFLSIRVEVASDLSTANQFYADRGFRKVREKAGGKSRNRRIFTRVRELSSPSLLDIASYGTADGPSISLTLATATKSPLFLIDLNVLFDVTKNRGNAVGAGRVFAAAIDNSVSLAVSSEFITELERNKIKDKPDQILEFSAVLPRLKKPDQNVISVYRDQLAPILFPERFAAKILTKQDQSDIVHLATAIEEGASGFITSEKAILASNDWFRRTHGLEVISPEVFGKRFTTATRSAPAYRVKFQGRSLAAGDAANVAVADIKHFISRQEIPSSIIKAALSAGNSFTPRRRTIVRAGDQIVAFGSWSYPKAHSRVERLYLFVDEGDPAAETAIDHIVESAARDIAETAPAVLYLTPPSDQIETRSRLLSLGFRPSAGSSSRSGTLEKLCLGRTVTEANWQLTRDQILELAGIELSVDPPVFRSPDDPISLKAKGGQHATTSLSHLENFVSPALFALRGRPATIVPIRPAYAEALFRGSAQPSFLDDQQAALLRERRYFGAARTYSSIHERGLLFFYESAHDGSGRSAAIAVARVVRRYLARKEIAAALSTEKGVLTLKDIGEMAQGAEVCVTEFDNLMLFSRPVALAQLKALKCADDSNMVTARKLNSDAASALIAAGEPTCSR